MIAAQSSLPPGVILEVFETAGIEVRGRGPKRKIRCPFHDDRHPSAVLFAEDNTFHCSTCSISLTAKHCAERLGVPWRGKPTFPCDFVRPIVERKPAEYMFSAADAERVWNAALAEIRDDSRVGANQEATTFLRARCVETAIDCGEDLLGFLPREVAHHATSSWYPNHSVIAPLYDESGSIQNVQARLSVSPVPVDSRKILFPAGSKAIRARFANRSGRALLRGDDCASRLAIVGEGMLDHVSLSLVRPSIPVFCAPGAAIMPQIIGPWVRGRTVFLGVHVDEAGERAALETAGRIFELGGKPKRLRWPGGALDASDALRELGPKRFEHEMLALLGVATEVS